MHISKLSLVNYRNFRNAKLTFRKGINTIIGENGSGKTNVFRAIRMLLDDNMIRAAYRMDQGDFNRSLSSWRGHWIIISLEFEEVSPDESVQSLFLHNTGDLTGDPVTRASYNLIFRPKKEIRLRLAALEDGNRAGFAAIRDEITISDYETVITGRSSADFNDPATYKRIVGDFENAIFSPETEFPEIGAVVSKLMSISQEVSFTFVQALRDVVAEFHNNRTNPLFALLKNRSGNINSQEFQSITAKVKDLNESIEALTDVGIVKGDILDTIKDTAGEAYSPTSLSIKSDLSDEANELFQSLKLFVGESGGGHEGPIHELSLGGANLIFLTLKLLEFKYRKAQPAIANFLVIEEPEAHIHNHIQKTLFDKLNYADTQIIYSTHSTQISEVSNVESINILAKAGNNCESFQPSSGLEGTAVRNVQRYLDAVRSNLLFAKSVILIEGDAEEILIPALVNKVLGISLDELGISLINIRSTGFANVAILFHEERIRKRCSILTDLDAAILDTTPIDGEPEADAIFRAKCARSAQVGADRKVALENFCSGNPCLELFLADHTFEVDFVKAGNSRAAKATVNQVYTSPPTIAAANSDFDSGDLGRYGRRILTMANQEGKGWFAILLSKYITSSTVIPRYVLDAIFHAHPMPSTEVWFNILSYRLSLQDDIFTSEEQLKDFEAKLEQFRKSNISFQEIADAMLILDENDAINPILARFR